MGDVIDLYQWRNAAHSLSHPAGVTLPLEGAGHADFLIPQIRHAICSGKHCADVIRALPGAIRGGDRVLLVGSGLGVLSTLVARQAGVEKVITLEPNVALARYVDDVHQVNGVPQVETVNALPAGSGQGRVPLFVRHDVRTSSLDPEDGAWRQVMLVPRMDLGLILAEERISLIVAECPAIFGALPGELPLGPVERMVIGWDPAAQEKGREQHLDALLGAGNFTAESVGGALVLSAEGQRTVEDGRRCAGGALGGEA